MTHPSTLQHAAPIYKLKVEIMKKFPVMTASFLALIQMSNPSQGAEIPKDKITEISRTVLERSDIEGSDEELRLMLVEFPPGFSNIPHIHPVGGLCYVIEGTAESQYDGEEIKIFHAGESYQDSANKKHLLFRNASKTGNLKFTCTAKIKKDTAFMQPL